MKNNQDLAGHVTAAIKWEPLMQGADIHVTALNGIITLTGIVDSNVKKYKAEDTAKSIIGVKAVIEHIELKFDNDDEKSDDAIANEIINALKADTRVPPDRLTIRVENGSVTLEGDLPRNFEKQAAAAAISSIDGIKVFTNAIRIQPDSADEVEQQAIQRALGRSSAMHHQDVHVFVKANHVILDGIVDSCFQKEEAERIAWSAPGIATLTNGLSINSRG